MQEEYLSLLEYEKLIIEQDINTYLGLLGKSYILESRIKSLDKVKLKQEYLKSKGRPCELYDIDDIIGFRISADTKEDLFLIEAFLESTFFYKYPMVKFVDFYAHPKETGYKAFNVFFMSHNGIRFEIQMMTKEMRIWTNKTHAEHDNRKYGKIISTKKINTNF